MQVETTERNQLYLKTRVSLGYPTVNVEVEDKALDVLLDMAVEDYSEYLNNWLINQRWGELQNMSKDNSDMLFSLMTKSLDLEREFSNAYSRQIEQASGKNYPSEWSLEVGSVTVSADTQVYEIPENREIMTVLWFTNPSINKTGFRSNFGSYGAGSGGTGLGGGSLGMGINNLQSVAMLPIYSTLLLAGDINMRESTFQSPMTYRVTQSGKKKLLWLYPIPGSRYEITNVNFTKHYEGYQVYYYYYDTSNNRDKCIEENYDHLILLPSDVELKKIKWTQLNDQAKTIIRKLLVAKAKQHVGIARGRFSGELNFGESNITMDYRMLIDQGEKEEENVFTNLKEYLEKLEYSTIMEKKAEIADNLMRVNQKIPIKNPIQRF